MRYFLFALALGLGAPVLAQDGPEARIQALIQNQISAFQSDDFDEAFRLASPMIQGIFGTAQNFGTMVQRGYPMVYRPKTVRMLGLRDAGDAGGVLQQRVMLTDQAGKLHVLEYEMIESPDGWQINSVQLLQQTGVGA